MPLHLQGGHDDLCVIGKLHTSHGETCQPRQHDSQGRVCPLKSVAACKGRIVLLVALSTGDYKLGTCLIS